MNGEMGGMAKVFLSKVQRCSDRKRPIARGEEGVERIHFESYHVRKGTVWLLGRNGGFLRPTPNRPNGAFAYLSRKYYYYVFSMNNEIYTGDEVQ